MTLDVWYWLFMALWLFFGLWRAKGQTDPWPYAGGHVLMFLLFLIIGLKAFGSPIK